MECVLCYQPLEAYSLLQCNHFEVCFICIYRLRHLLNDKRCPLCRLESERVFITINGNLQYDQVENSKWGDVYPGFFQDSQQTEMYFQEKQHHQTILSLGVGKCCNQDFYHLTKFTQHLKKEHKKYICQICIQHSKTFLNDLPQFNQKQLYQHQRETHVTCQICRQQQYNDEILLQHYQVKHFMCNFCDSNYKVVFENQQQLWIHYNETHYTCNHQICEYNPNCVFLIRDHLVEHLREAHQDYQQPGIKLFFRAQDEGVKVEDQSYKNFTVQDLTAEEIKMEFPVLDESKSSQNNSWGQKQIRKVPPRQKQAVRPKQSDFPSLNDLQQRIHDRQNMKQIQDTQKQESTKLVIRQQPKHPNSKKQKVAKPNLTQKDFPSMQFSDPVKRQEPQKQVHDIYKQENTKLVIRQQQNHTQKQQKSKPNLSQKDFPSMQSGTSTQRIDPPKQMNYQQKTKPPNRQQTQKSKFNLPQQDFPAMQSSPPVQRSQPQKQVHNTQKQENTKLVIRQQQNHIQNQQKSKPNLTQQDFPSMQSHEQNTPQKQPKKNKQVRQIQTPSSQFKPAQKRPEEQKTQYQPNINDFPQMISPSQQISQGSNWGKKPQKQEKPPDTFPDNAFPSLGESNPKQQNRKSRWN